MSNGHTRYRPDIDGLRAPHTINTMPESTLRAFADHGRVGEPIAADGGDAEATLAQFEAAGVDVDALADTLQSDGARDCSSLSIVLPNAIWRISRWSRLSSNGTLYSLGLQSRSVTYANGPLPGLLAAGVDL